ncbi:M48 family metallopeptidase [Rhodocyclaceae bacterium SMB388]
MAGQALKRLLDGDPKVEGGRQNRGSVRRILVREREVPYALRRSARRSFALQVDAAGVRVAAPARARIEDIERFIHSHSNWLLGKLDARAERLTRQRFEVVDGAIFPLFGRPCRLRLLAGPRGTHWSAASDGGEELRLAAGVDPRKAMIVALKKRAHAWFAGRVDEYCHRLGRVSPQVRVSSARTRWGSCSAMSGIRLHWRLVHLPAALGDYVVAHEVAHLIEMNHSPRFWAVVEALYPDWRAARAELRKAAGDLPLIDATAGTDIRED